MSEVTLRSAKVGFYPVYKFMERELGLKCNALRVYALIFSYTMGEAGMYYGRKNYLASSLSLSVRTVYRAIDYLTERGLVEVTVSSDGKRSGIRCTFVHERDRASGASGEGGFVFTEEQKNKALDNIVRKRYGDMPQNLHLAARAAVRDNIAREAKQRAASEAADRITLSLAYRDTV